MLTLLRILLASIAALVTAGLVSPQAMYAESGQTSLALAQERAASLLAQLAHFDTVEKKYIALSEDPIVKSSLAAYPSVQEYVNTATLEEAYVLKIAAALNQFDTLFAGLNELNDTRSAISSLTSTLSSVEDFYSSLGGLLGYHKTVLTLLMAKEPPMSNDRFYPPPVNDMRQKAKETWKNCYNGVKQVPKSSQIFVLGGAGDRLKLIDPKTGEPLPAACLPFKGKSLFEGLMRDVEAQEYWHYRTFGTQVTMPILIMTSLEKNNDQHIQEMLKKANWFGRNASTIRRMVQPLVPVIDTEGTWIVTAPAELALKPGGHGIIWKLAKISGGLQWLHSHHIEHAIVRQINNPLAGIDNNISVFSGFGMSQNKSFGFASPPSKPGLAEGLNVLEVSHSPTPVAAITNIEYTQFNVLKGLLPDLFKEGTCPANTNLLYANLAAIERAISKDSIPGLIVNPKTTIEIVKNGQVTKKTGARLESSMQNIADVITSPIDPTLLPNIPPSALQTFICLFDRAKVMSAIKRAYQQGQSPIETPESCLYDWHNATRKLLANNCHFSLPLEQSFDEFMQNGPNFIFSFHPAIGPLWEVIGQKVTKGSIAENSELDLEIAEIACSNLTLDGSLRITAERVTGKSSADGKLFTNEVGRVHFTNVRIQNKGLGEKTPASISNGTEQRLESCEITLQGFSELVANNITISGNFTLVVPDGHRATLSQLPGGGVNVSLESIKKPSWQYDISWSPESAPALSIET